MEKGGARRISGEEEEALETRCENSSYSCWIMWGTVGQKGVEL